MKNSKIEWCDHTFNPWIGCAKVSPGCDNCYAEAMMDRRLRKVKWGKGHPRLANKALADWKRGILNPAPFAWNRQARQENKRHRVFCGSLCDWLDPEAPVELLARLLIMIERTGGLDWLLLTKRPELWADRLWAVIAHLAPQSGWAQTQDRIAAWLDGTSIPDNIWIGATVENQPKADKRIPELLKIPARARFLSCEPLLGRIDLTRCPGVDGGTIGPGLFSGVAQAGIDWVICGGESGPRARPMHPDWARALRDQCQKANTPFLFKQWGEWLPCGFVEDDAEYQCEVIEGTIMLKVGKRAAGRRLDGLEHNESPESYGGMWNGY